MVELYVKLIINNRRSFDQIPPEYQADVQSKLMEYGYNFNGNPITEEE